MSADNGLTWTVRTVPGSLNGDWDPSVGIGCEQHRLLRLRRRRRPSEGRASRTTTARRGRTIRDVGVPFGIKHTAFPAVVAGDDDRAAFAFLGSTEPSAGAFADDPSWPGVWHLYVADDHRRRQHVDDRRRDAERSRPARHDLRAAARPAATTARATCSTSWASPSTTAAACWSATRTAASTSCSVSGPNSFTALATIARQVNGPRLFARTTPQRAPAAPSLSGKAQARRTCSLVGARRSRLADHGLQRSTAASQAAASRCSRRSGRRTTSYADSALTAGQSYAYHVTAVNADGESAASNDVSPAPAAPAPNPCIAPGRADAL